MLFVPDCTEILLSGYRQAVIMWNALGFIAIVEKLLYVKKELRVSQKHKKLSLRRTIILIGVDVRFIVPHG